MLLWNSLYMTQTDESWKMNGDEERKKINSSSAQREDWMTASNCTRTTASQTVFCNESEHSEV